MKIKSAAGHKLAFYNPAGSHGGAPTSTSVRPIMNIMEI